MQTIDSVLEQSNASGVQTSGDNIEKRTLSTQRVNVSQQLQSQIAALMDTIDTLTASNTALKTKVAFLLSYLRLQEFFDGPVTNSDSSVIVSKKSFANLITESLLTFLTRPSEVTRTSTTAPTGTPAAAIPSSNLPFKQVLLPSATFNKDQNKLNKTIQLLC